MYPKNRRALPIAVALIGAVALHGCGGGGGSMTGIVTPVPPPVEPRPATLTIPTGMTASTAPGVTARGVDDTIASLLPDSGREFAPVSARATMDEFHVTAISSDGNNGFRVTYVVAGQERTVHFEADDLGADSGSSFEYYAETQDGGRFWLYSQFGGFSGEDRNQGSAYFDYHDVHNSGVYGYGTSNRQYLTFGARTGAANLPAGTAGYSGLVGAESHRTDTLERSSARGRYEGSWRLTADFSQSTLTGDIRMLRGRRPGESASRNFPHTTYFRIEGGQIVDGQFTAQVSGMDSNPSPTLEETVEGFEGNVLGEFYGPGAEEAGGVLRATRASDNRVLVGSFGGKRMPVLNPTLPAGTLSSQSFGLNRNYVARTVQLTSDAKVTAIEGDGVNGFHVAYLVDGAEHRVHLAEQIYFNQFDEFALFSHQAAGLFVLGDQTGSFAGTPEFSHFDVHGWAVGRFAVDGALQSVLQGFVVSGDPTEASDLPAGTATYEGRAHFLGWPSDNPRLAENVRGDGRLTLNADFDASTVRGAIDQLVNLLGPIDELSVEDGTIQDGELMAGLRGAQNGATFDGNMSGEFFGPGADEVGGVLEGSYTSVGVDVSVTGWFGGRAQSQ